MSEPIRHPLTAADTQLLGISRLAVRLQEAGDAAAILGTLDSGLRDQRLLGLVGRLSPGSRVVRFFLPGASSDVAAEAPGLDVALDASPTLALVVRSRETAYVAGAGDDLISLLRSASPPDDPLSPLPGVSRAVCAPMMVHGQLSGLLIVFGDDLEVEARTAFRSLADALAVALENATIVRELKLALLREHAAARELRRLKLFVAELAAEADVQLILRRAVLAIADVLSLEQVGIYLREDAAGPLVLAVSTALSGTLAQSWEDLPGTRAGGPIADISSRRTSLAVPDIRLDPAWAAVRDSAEAAGIRSVLVLPLIAHDRAWLGLAVACSSRPSYAEPALLDLAQQYADHAAAAIARTRHAQRELERVRQEVVREVARTVPHELAQPLAIITGYAELIADGRLMGDRLREACREISQASSLLAELVARFERTHQYVTRDFGPGRNLLDLERASEPRHDEE